MMESMRVPASTSVQCHPQSTKTHNTQGRLKTDFGHPELLGVHPVTSPELLEGNTDQCENPQKAVHGTRLPGSGLRPYLSVLNSGV